MTSYPSHFQAKGVSLLWLTYLSYLLVLPSIFGMLVNEYEAKMLRPLADQNGEKNADVAQMLWSHHVWLRRTFWLFVVFAMMALGTAYYGFGLLVGVGAIVWWLYRVVRGMIALSGTHPMPVQP